MENVTVPPLSKDTVSVGEAVKAGIQNKWGHHHHRWGKHQWSHMRRGGLLAAGAFIAVPTFGGYLNSVYAAAKDKEDPWVKSLKMPSWCLPEPMFSPIWTACYSSMGLASFLVWRHGGGFSGKAQIPLLLYGSQLALNLSWIPVCYKTKSLKQLSLMSVGTLVLAGAATASFHKVQPAAAYVMTPYLLWLVYETCLTISMYLNNKETRQE